MPLKCVHLTKVQKVIDATHPDLLTFSQVFQWKVAAFDTMAATQDDLHSLWMDIVRESKAVDPQAEGSEEGAFDRITKFQDPSKVEKDSTVVVAVTPVPERGADQASLDVVTQAKDSDCTADAKDICRRWASTFSSNQIDDIAKVHLFMVTA